MALDDHVQRVREALITKMGGSSYLRPRGLVNALASDLAESPLTVQQCLGRLVKEGWLDGVSPDGTPIGQVKILGHVPVVPIDPNLQRWLSVMDAAGIATSDQQVLSSLGTKLADFTDIELGSILQGLLDLRTNLSGESGRHRFLVSARYLLGSSKLLDTLSTTALRSFGIPVEAFPSHPLYVVVAGCANPETVVLVENPAAFELAISTRAVEQCAFVATFGFGLSKSQEDYGNQLAGMVEDRFAHAITLTREGSTCPPARELLNHPRITFWGDTDIAGLHIYLRLRRSIPALRLSALYAPSLASLQDVNKSHPYVSAVGKSGQVNMVAPSEVDAAIFELFRYCEARGIDQEQLRPELIESLAQYEMRSGG
ncbi:MAG: DUF2220 family protein [Sideroxyarcus sp.]|nr:DUF2220 family protein [Sideroxyarcus sp.]